MIGWTVFKILFGKFAEGFLVGVVLRVLLSLLLRFEMTVGGLLRTATVIGLISLGLWVYVAMKLFGG
jgi:hypothetical protein